MTRFATTLLPILLVMLAMDALACGCVEPTGDPEHDVPPLFRDATAVIVAEANEASYSREPAGEGPPTEVQSVAWEVEVSFKGPHLPGHIVRTVTDTTCCLCGLSVITGRVYLLYVKGEQPYSISECSLSRELKHRVPHIPVLYRLQSEAAHGGGV